MTLPPPPDSFFDGGEPRSVSAPGDTGRELLHEVRNLASVVMLLQATVRGWDRQRRQVLVAGLCSVLLLSLGLGYTRYESVRQIRQRIQASHAACVADRNRGQVEIEILTASESLSTPMAKAFFEPRIVALQRLQKNCDALFPSPGGKGWPNFFGSN